jgi:hypothetical protein
LVQLPESLKLSGSSHSNKLCHSLYLTKKHFSRQNHAENFTDNEIIQILFGVYAFLGILAENFTNKQTNETQIISPTVFFANFCDTSPEKEDH